MEFLILILLLLVLVKKCVVVIHGCRKYYISMKPKHNE